MANTKMQTITTRIPIEDYGWLNRYCEANDVSQSQAVRKAIRMFIVANNAKKKKKDGEVNG